MLLITEAQQLTQVKFPGVFPLPEIETDKKAVEERLNDVDFSAV